MATSEMFEALVDDTLHGRNVLVSGCFAVNKTGIELMEQDSSVLPVIETALQKIDLSKEDSDGAESWTGLDEVLMAYHVIAARSFEHASTVEFLDRLPPELQCKAIDAAGWVFGKQKGVHRFSVAPPALLLAYIRKSLGSQISTIRESAEQACQRISTAES